MEIFHTLRGELESHKHPGRRYPCTVTFYAGSFVVRLDTGLSTPSVTRAKAKIKELGLGTDTVTIIGKHYFITGRYPSWRNPHTAIILAIEMADRLVTKLS